MRSSALLLLCKVPDYAKSRVIGAHAEGLKGSDHPLLEVLPEYQGRGIGAELNFRRLHIRVAQPERDFAEIPRGLQDHHGTGVTQDMR